MTLTVITYIAYLLITVPITVWVATTLGRNGRAFLGDVFAGHTALADAVNRLLVVGFYLVTLGFVTLFLPLGGDVPNVRQVFEALSGKIGLVLLLLGVLHLINVKVFSTIRHRRLAETRPQPRPPMAPPAWPAAPPAWPAAPVVAPPAP